MVFDEPGPCLQDCHKIPAATLFLCLGVSLESSVDGNRPLGYLVNLFTVGVSLDRLDGSQMLIAI